MAAVSGILQVFSWSTVALHPGVGSSVGSMIGILVLSNVGAAIAEVVSDALVAESVQKERGHSKGELQSLVWLALAMGGVAGNLSGGFAVSRLPSTTMFAIFSTLLAAQLVACALVREDAFGFKLVARKKKPEQGAPAASIAQVVRLQASKLIDLVAKPEIVQPLAWFAASYAVIPTLGGSLFFFQTQHLRINPTFLGLAKVIGQTGLVLASLLFNRFLKHSSPRRVLASLQILLALCMLCDIALVCRLNLRAGIPDHLFVLGASAFVEAIAQFKLLPFTVLLTQLCPAGSEASLLAAFMSCHCLASIFSGYFGTALASLLHLSAENFTGLPLGILIQSLAALVPLLWVSSIPNSYGKAVAARG